MPSRLQHVRDGVGTGVAVNSAGDRVYVAQTGGETVVKILDGKGNALGTLVAAGRRDR
jgi:DNA-binding beta-propeller fold protein YncE